MERGTEMLASPDPILFNGNMESQPTPAASARRAAAPQPKHADWRPAPGLIDRMLAYRDWWNIPEGRRRPAVRNRARPQERAG
jgi:hypothetical protein